MKESCASCRHCLRLEKWDYTNGGCLHEQMLGFTCLAFQDEVLALWEIGVDKDKAICEEYERRTK